LFPTHGVMLAESETQNTLFYSSLLLLLLICFALSNPFFQKRARMLTMRERRNTDPTNSR
jgi:hypothetical protein